VTVILEIDHYQLLFGIQYSTQCIFADDSRFADCPGIQGKVENPARGNYLAIWHFAWVYILSVCSVEMQQSTVTLCVSAARDDTMVYMCDQAKWISDCSEYELKIDLGDVDDNAAQWWTAILATIEGWRVEFRQNGNNYQLP
jgi:hypothetical protein